MINMIVTNKDMLIISYYRKVWPLCRRA